MCIFAVLFALCCMVQSQSAFSPAELSPKDCTSETSTVIQIVGFLKWVYPQIIHVTRIFHC